MRVERIVSIQDFLEKNVGTLWEKLGGEWKEFESVIDGIPEKPTHRDIENAMDKLQDVLERSDFSAVLPPAPHHVVSEREPTPRQIEQRLKQIKEDALKQGNPDKAEDSREAAPGGGDTEQRGFQWWPWGRAKSNT